MTIAAVPVHADRLGTVLERVAIVAILVALSIRPASTWSSWLFLATGLVAAVGLRGSPRAPIALLRSVGVGVIGLAPFVLVRLTGVGRPSMLGAFAIGVVVVAAFAEEAFFRGLLHDRLQRIGLAPLAIGAVTASLFALIHVSTYGAWVLPLDLAAGAVLAWQRHASGTWIVPAVTHACANLLQLG